MKSHEALSHARTVGKLRTQPALEIVPKLYLPLEKQGERSVMQLNSNLISG